jgi:hypothetical protein
MQHASAQNHHQSRFVPIPHVKLIKNTHAWGRRTLQEKKNTKNDVYRHGFQETPLVGGQSSGVECTVQALTHVLQARTTFAQLGD